jgi:4-amino-4-deoxy-L-arabinose transferase-like glycosyltransferase
MVAVSPILLPVYSWAMAEPLTIALGFSGLCLCLWYLKTRTIGKNKWIVAAGLLLGLAFMTRYSAAAFLAAGILMNLIWLDEKFKRRIQFAFILGLAGVIPVAAWVFVQIGQTATVSSRSILTFSQMIERFSHFWPQLNNAIVVWLVPASFLDVAPYSLWINQALPLAGLIGLASLCVFLNPKNPQTVVRYLVQMLWLFSGLYFLVILLVYLTTYPPITIDNRMLSPMHIAMVWLTGLVFAEGIHRTRKTIRVIIIALALVFVGWYGLRTWRIVQQNAVTGLGYNAITWKASPLISRLRLLDDKKGIVTNEPMAVLYLTGRISQPLAEIYFDEPVMTFARYGDGQPDLDPVEADFQKGKSLLVIFNTLASQLQPIYGEEAQNRANSLLNNLDIVLSTEDGAILEYPASGQPPM